MKTRESPNGLRVWTGERLVLSLGEKSIQLTPNVSQWGWSSVFLTENARPLESPNLLPDNRSSLPQGKNSLRTAASERFGTDPSVMTLQNTLRLDHIDEHQLEQNIRLKHHRDISSS